LELHQSAVFLDRRRAAVLSANDIFITRTTALPPPAKRRRWLQAISAVEVAHPMTALEWRSIESEGADL
jgi:hypothetical protein